MTAGGLALFALLTGGCADRLVLYPSTRPIDPCGADRRLLSTGTGQVEVFVARSPGCGTPGCGTGVGPAAYDVELVGNGSRAEQVAAPSARRWGDRPVEVWAVNYPGYGTSTGPAALSKLVSSAVAAYDAVADRAGGRPILLGSHSLGTAVALRLATLRPAAGIILVNPPPLRQLVLGRFGWWNLWLAAGVVALQVPAELDSLANAATLCRTPAVFVSSGRDTLVPPAYHRRVYDAYAGPKSLVHAPAAGHNDVPDPARSSDYRRATEWLWQAAVDPSRR